MRAYFIQHRAAVLPLVIFSLSLSSLLLSSCQKGDSSAAAASVAKADSTKRDDAVPVNVARPRVGSVPATLTFNTTIEAEGSVDVFSEIPGLIERLVVEEGDRVRKGALLLKLKEDDLLLARDKAEVVFRKLESRFGRTKEMWDQHLISQQDYDTARYELEQARLEWEQAKLNLARATLVAPEAGVIAERAVRQGDRVAVGSRLMTVVRTDRLVARVPVPERDASRLAIGQPASISSEFSSAATYAGRIERIAPVIDVASGTMKVTVAIQGADSHLRPGAFVTVQIVTATHAAAILIPKSAAVYDGDRSYVFVVRSDTTAKRLPLKIGFSTREELEVAEGVARDDRIIVVGQAGLKDGARIKVVAGSGS